MVMFGKASLIVRFAIEADNISARTTPSSSYLLRTSMNVSILTKGVSQRPFKALATSVRSHAIPSLPPRY